MKALKSKISIIVALIMMAAMFVSCGGDSEKNSDIKVQHYPVKIGDTAVNAMPQKVVSLSPSITDIIYALGNESRLSGVSVNCDNPGELPVLGTALLPETDKIIELGANVVFAPEQLPETEKSRLDTHGIVVVVIKYADSFDAWKQTYTDVALVMSGNISGKQNAEATFTRIKTKLDETKALVPAAIPAVFFIDGETAFTGDSFVSSMMEFAGCENIAGTAAGSAFSYAAAAAVNPQVIFTFTGGKAGVMANEALKATEAVTSGRVIEIDPKLVERQGETVTELVRQMAAGAHPETFAAEAESEVSGSESDTASSEASSTAQ